MTPAAPPHAAWNYTAPWWLPGGHAQTIWASLFSHTGQQRASAAVPYRRTRWDTPDGDFIDLDWLIDSKVSTAKTDRPLLVLFHGLEGNSDGHYAQAFARTAQAMGMDFVVPHFRGCSGEINRAPRAYHSGDYVEIAWVLERLRQQHAGPLYAVGISLGGNALLRWAQESGHTARSTAAAICAVCAPLDLTACGMHISNGFNHLVYGRRFLHTMKPKALQKWDQFPGLFDREALLRARTVLDFDQAFTAPLHGFTDAMDYWRRASAKPHLHSLRLPALVVNARNDPFVPEISLPTPRDIAPDVQLWQPVHGGHVGFPSGAPPGHLGFLPGQVLHWFNSLG
ncbi:MAG: alpha/beta fold hydrolase [Betaproteobacteria bacterium]|nr:alpha/beta fold hydrolase [Betaproteobacteria bacterium]